MTEKLLKISQRLIKWDSDFPVNSHNGYAGLKELDAIIADAKVAVHEAGASYEDDFGQNPSPSPNLEGWRELWHPQYASLAHAVSAASQDLIVSADLVRNKGVGKRLQEHARLLGRIAYDLVNNPPPQANVTGFDLLKEAIQSVEASMAADAPDGEAVDRAHYDVVITYDEAKQILAGLTPPPQTRVLGSPVENQPVDNEESVD